jgi:branched-chain amino acid transport system ATP-binding protein
MPENAMLEVRGLTKRFGGLLAVDGVRLSVGQRVIHSIIGPNGAGKTTLFNLITGAIKPDEGSVTFEGRAVTAMEPHKLARLGVVRTFQRTSVFGLQTTLANVMLSIAVRRGLSGQLRMAPPMREEVHAEAMDILGAVGLGDLVNALAGSLSHGNQRALDLAIGVALKPKVLMMDEPLAGMAEGDRERIAVLIVKLRDEHGLGIVVVEHDIGMVMRLSDRITVLHNGKVLAEGDADSVRHNDDVKRAYLHGAFAV